MAHLNNLPKHRKPSMLSSLEIGGTAKGLFDIGRGMYQGVSTYGPMLMSGLKTLGPMVAAATISFKKNLCSIYRNAKAEQARC